MKKSPTGSPLLGFDDPVEFADKYLEYLSSLLKAIDRNAIARLIVLLEQTAAQSNSVYFIGNGGSAATAIHFANDMGIGLQAEGQPRLRAFSLADNQAAITAIANDSGFDQVFVQQLRGLIETDDMLVALSVSGNSPNIIEAVNYAKTQGARVVGCSGFDGGALKELSDLSIHIDTHRGEYGPVEDIFQILDHLVYTYLRIKRRGHL